MTTVQFPEQRYSFLHCYVGITPEGHLASFQVDTASFGLKGKAGECKISPTCLPVPQPNTMSGSVLLHYLSCITYINYLLTYGLKMKAYRMNSNLTYAVPSTFTIKDARS